MSDLPKSHSFLFLSLVLAIFLCFSGCSVYRPGSLEDFPILERAQTKEDSDVLVSIVVLSARESEQVFGVPLALKGIQPVWLKIGNKGNNSLLFLQHFVEPEYYSPQEAAYMSRLKVKRATGTNRVLFFLPDLIFKPFQHIQAKFITRKILADFHERGVHNTLIEPGETVSGFMFTPFDEGTKKVSVVLYQKKEKTEFLFSVNVPGLKQDYLKRDFVSKFSEEEFVSLDEAGLLDWAESLPQATTNKSGKREGDPLNLIVVGELDTILSVFALAKWDETESLAFRSAWKMKRAYMKGDSYRYSPISSLFYDGRRHDIALQKTRGGIHERLHLRLWLTPMLFQENPVWVGQVSRDIGIRFTTRTWNLMTHKIDPNVDDSREYVFG
ncbi:MAG: hypothetical protein GY777_22170, partial [Candidatus Brocadiaceae bacterium]|nr:hypothetical protein [Candidatus Brocadiaceae bacterium]